MNLRQLPNAISLTRLALAPTMVAVVFATGSRAWFLAILATSLLTDAVDGILARRLNAMSDLGRRLDSWGDYATVVGGMIGVWRLWPDIIDREQPWFAVLLAGYFALVCYGLLRFRRVLGYHTWMAKMMAVALPLSLVPLLAGWSATPFHAAVVLQVVCGVEEMAIAITIPSHRGTMPSLWHALRMRRDQRRTGGGKAA